MRKTFSHLLYSILEQDESTVFMSADLGFNAFEEIQAMAGDRFINAGVAEQNMVGVAAGLAYQGHPTFVYNIAPFAIFRCFEQIKIDVCLHDLPVYLIGNGGGYGYGVMGVTHHALEDIGCLTTLPTITCYVPAFAEDVNYCMKAITRKKKPAYLRLGLSCSYPSMRTIRDQNEILVSDQPKLTIVAMGPVVANALSAIGDRTDIALFTIICLPFQQLDSNLKQSILISKKVLVIEEHVQRGGLSEHLLSALIQMEIPFTKFVSLHAKGYPDNLYGDQAFHQQQSELDVLGIENKINELLAK